MAEYRVKTAVYNGPMDLLLYLIRRDEVDIYDIPIAHVTEQYCRHVEMLQVIDPNVAGDFLVLAAMLMEIKSRMLLPRQLTEEGGPEDLGDPRLELVRQLLEYKRFKDASFELGTAAQQQAHRWPRIPAKIRDREPAEVDVEDIQIWDLVAAFNKLMSGIGAGSATHDVIFDDTPIALHAADLLDRMQAEGGELGFENVFVGRTKVEMIGLFLALLELMRQQRLRVTQTDAFAPIKVILISTEPIVVGEEWASTTREAFLSLEPDHGNAAAPVERPDDIAHGAESQTDAADSEAEGEIAFDELEGIKTEPDLGADPFWPRDAGPTEDQEHHDP